jgi:uncharacterized protein YecT (DUF1311 family)
MHGKIFFSYRRSDEGSAGRLSDALKATFGADQVFFDVDNIEPGLDFVQVIQERIAQSKVLLAIIGKNWCDERAVDGSRRLDDPSDHVRVEIESAIGQKKRVIPVLIGDIKMPVAENLPESLRYLARCQAVPIRHAGFGDDTARLTEALKRALRKPNIADRISSAFGGRLQNRTAARFAIVILALAIAASAVAVLYSGPAPQASLPLQPADSKEVPAVSSQPEWCLKQNLKPDERRICASQALWKLDNEQAALYQTAAKMAAPDKLAALRDGQNIWIRDTRGGCLQDENCLQAKLRERIAYFNKLKSN